MKYVQNFTDIDDKILKRAKEESSSMKEVSEKNIIEFHKDMDSLGIMRPDSMPRATNHICNICSFITILEDKGYAYSRDGDVYYSVFKNKNYGKLSIIFIFENRIINVSIPRVCITFVLKDCYEGADIAYMIRCSWHTIRTHYP